jgi:hypothetical protein
MKRIMQVFHEETAPSREDSAQVRQSCGPLPPRLPAEDQLDAYERDVASLEEQIRGIDEKVAAAQAKEGGLDRNQWGMALERIQMYLDWMRSKPDTPRAHRGFSPTELDVLEKYLEQLRAALG